ncbi:MAG: spore coat protein CotJB [Lachnospiraceae bacterium]|nr:spore coat protein CotJB [Lachnospiraceae bacterium]
MSQEQERLFMLIERVSFVMDDTRLFLDTHPYDNAALSYYQKMQEVRAKAVAEYEAKFGTLTQYGYATGNEWNWNDCPLPWL